MRPDSAVDASVSCDWGAPVFPAGKSWADAATTAPEALLATVNGPFASVIPRAGGGGSLMAVDRFAQRTLCWQQHDGQLRHAVRADAFGVRDIDPQGLYDYLFFHALPSPRTIFKGVHRLPPGHLAEWDGRAVSVRPFGRLQFQPRREVSFEAEKAVFQTLLRNAVAAELDGGIPACYLSGGTDSSTVAGMLKAVAGDAHCYSIGFDAEGYDEMEFARIAARHFGVKHHEYYVTPDDLVRYIPQVAAAFDQPFGNSSALPAFCCALRAAEDGVTKLLAGDGGDELFGGNQRYVDQKAHSAWSRVPGWVREGLVKPVLRATAGSNMDLLRRGRNYVRDAELGMPQRLYHYNLLRRIGVENVLTKAFVQQARPDAVLDESIRAWGLAGAEHELDRQLAYDWRYTLAECDLPKVMWSAAMAGVKVGFPMLDDALVDFSMTLPPDYKVRGDRLRWFFKEALADFLPREIIEKQKKGFGLPFGQWSLKHAGLKALTEDSLNGFAQRGVIRPEFVKSLLGELLPQSPGYYGEMAWIIMMLEQWLRKQLPDWRLQA